MSVHTYSIVLSVLLSSTLSLRMSLHASDHVVLMEENKIIKGLEVRFSEPKLLRPVWTFRGLRYAALGTHRDDHDTKQRFQQSIAAFFFEDPKGTVVKDSFGPVCPQNVPSLDSVSHKWHPSQVEHLARILPFLQHQSEECLTLNLYVPQHLQDGQSSSPLMPVVLFIHGESYEYGSGNAYDLSVIASYGQVIGITFNYRLGLLGFLVTNEGESMGNLALLDLSAVLSWIGSHIRQFGGDPLSITILGHGYGAALAHLFLLSQLAENPRRYRIQRVVLLNGSGVSPLSTTSPRVAAGLMSHLQLQLNATSSEQVYQLLKRMPAKELLELQSRFPRLDYASRLGPVLLPQMFSRFPCSPPSLERRDVGLMPCSPVLHPAGNEDLKVDLLVGLTSEPAIVFTPQSRLLRGLTRDQRNAALRTFVNQNFFPASRQRFALHTLQFNYEPVARKGSKQRLDETQIAMGILQTWRQLLNDGLFVAPLLDTAMSHVDTSLTGMNNLTSVNNQLKPLPHPPRRHHGKEPPARQRPANSQIHYPKRSTKTFVYSWSRKPDSRSDPQISQAMYGEDLRYLFGAPMISESALSPFPDTYSEEERALSETALRYLVNFIQFGDPNSPSKHSSPRKWNFKLSDPFIESHWREFSADERFILHIDNLLEPFLQRDMRWKELALWRHLLMNWEHESIPLELNMTTDHDDVGGINFTYQAPAWLAQPPTATPLTEMVTRIIYRDKFLKPNDATVEDTSETGFEPATPEDLRILQQQRNAFLLTVVAGSVLIVLNVAVFLGISYQSGLLARGHWRETLTFRGWNQRWWCSWCRCRRHRRDKPQNGSESVNCNIMQPIPMTPEQTDHLPPRNDHERHQMLCYFRAPLSGPSMAPQHSFLLRQTALEPVYIPSWRSQRSDSLSAGVQITSLGSCMSVAGGLSETTLSAVASTNATIFSPHNEVTSSRCEPLSSALLDTPPDPLLLP